MRSKSAVELLSDYRASLVRRAYSHASIVNRLNRIRQAGQLAKKHVLDLDRDDIHFLMEQWGVSPNTTRTYLAELGSFYSWAKEEGHVAQNPVRRADKPRKQRKQPQVWPEKVLSETWGDLKADETPEGRRIHVMIALIAFAGLRCIEVSRMRCEDIDTERMRMTVRGKGNKERSVRLHTEILAAITRYRPWPATGQLIVPLDREHEHIDRAITPGWISRLVSRHLPAGWTAHPGRARCASQLLALGDGDPAQNLNNVREFLGHADLSSTIRYLDVDTAAQGRLVDRLTIP